MIEGFDDPLVSTGTNLQESNVLGRAGAISFGPEIMPVDIAVRIPEGFVVRMIMSLPQIEER